MPPVPDDDDVTPPLEDDDNDEVAVPLEPPPEDEDEDEDEEEEEEEEEDELLDGGMVELAPVALLFAGCELAPALELGLGLLELLKLTALDPPMD